MGCGWGEPASQAGQQCLQAESSSFIKGLCVSRNYRRPWLVGLPALAGAFSVGVKSAARRS